MNAGYELDKAVAEACGIEYENSYYVQQDGSARSVVIRRLGGDCGCSFYPSTDWNDATLAADKCGLFDKCVLGKAEGQFTIVRYEDRLESAENESGPVAICLAILRLKKKL